VFQESDLLSGIKPLADPVRIVTIVVVANAALAVLTGMATGRVWNGLGVGCLLLGLALLIAAGKPNAIFLRAFRTDKSTAKLRAEIAAILGPDFRLSGIRPPRERTSVFMRFFMSGFFALKYAGSKFMELEAGDDWMARLWRTLQTTRLVLIDVRDLTSYLQHEIRLTLETVGVSRVVFVIGKERIEGESRQILAKYCGQEHDPGQLQLLEASPYRLSSGRLASDLQRIVKQLPASAPGESEAGRQFVLDHVSGELLANSGLSSMWKATAAAGLLCSLSLGPLMLLALQRLQGDSGLILVLTFGLAGLSLILALTLVGIFRGASRARRLERAGHHQGAMHARALLVPEILLFLANPTLIGVQFVKHLAPLAREAQELAAITALRTLNVAEVQYNSMYTDVGFACQLSALGGNTDSSAPSPEAAQLIPADLASGKKGGYTFALSNCTKTGYVITATPDMVGQTGVRGFCSNEKLEISYDPKGGTNCAAPVQ
jgi:type IV pilus assembly protein PilA